LIEEEMKVEEVEEASEGEEVKEASEGEEVLEASEGEEVDSEMVEVEVFSLSEWSSDAV
jgi:hypothetical protein